MTSEENKEQELDTSFEIITLREKYLKEQLEIAEDSLMKSEFNVKVNKLIIDLTNQEILKEHESTQKQNI